MFERVLASRLAFTARDERRRCSRLAQCAHIDLPNDRLSAARWTEALNALYLQLFACFAANTCRMIFMHGFRQKENLSLQNLVGSRSAPIRISSDLAHRASDRCQNSKRRPNISSGTHDFAGFAANRGKQEKSTVRTIYSVRVRQEGRCVITDFDGDGFRTKWFD